MANNNFKERIKIDDDIKIAIDGVAEAYRQQGRKLEEEDRKKLERYLRKLNKEVER